MQIEYFVLMITSPIFLFIINFLKDFFFLLAVGTPILNRVTSGFLEDQLF